MRIIIIRHPNTQVRAIVCDQVITDKFVSDYEPIEGNKGLVRLQQACKSFPLVERISISKHEVSVTIADGFQDSEQDWEGIETYVITLLHTYFGLDICKFNMDSIKIDDRRAKYLRHSDPDFESGNIQDYEVNITALKRFVDGITIPHDFKTHRVSWRKGLETALAYVKTVHVDNSDANILYWEHELKAFDQAFDRLLALNLPES